eukprot:COSAG01_NODE_10733_length_2092_cov_48.772704_1_plen_198_part_00
MKHKNRNPKFNEGAKFPIAEGPTWDTFLHEGEQPIRKAQHQVDRALRAEQIVLQSVKGNYSCKSAGMAAAKSDRMHDQLPARLIACAGSRHQQHNMQLTLSAEARRSKILLTPNNNRRQSQFTKLLPLPAGAPRALSHAASLPLRERQGNGGTGGRGDGGADRAGSCPARARIAPEQFPPKCEAGALHLLRGVGVSE